MISPCLRRSPRCFWEVVLVFGKLEVLFQSIWEAFWGAEKLCITSLHLRTPLNCVYDPPNTCLTSSLSQICRCRTCKWGVATLYVHHFELPGGRAVYKNKQTWFHKSRGFHILTVFSSLLSAFFFTTFRKRYQRLRKTLLQFGVAVLVSRPVVHKRKLYQVTGSLTASWSFLLWLVGFVRLLCTNILGNCTHQKW